MCFIQKLAKFLYNGSMGQPVLSLIQIFQKMLETDIKYELLMEIYKESLTNQYESFENWSKFCERKIWIEPYCL